MWYCQRINTKTHWTLEELHQIMGCCKFWNYKHLILVSHDGEWLDGGEFPPSLGAYATTSKANSGGPLNWKKYNTLAPFTWTLLLRTVFTSVAAAVLSSWLTKLTDIIGHLDWKTFHSTPFFLQCGSFAVPPAPLPRASSVIVTLNSLGPPSGNISLTTSLRWLLP